MLAYSTLGVYRWLVVGFRVVQFRGRESIFGGKGLAIRAGRGGIPWAGDWESGTRTQNRKASQEVTTHHLFPPQRNLRPQLQEELSEAESEALQLKKAAELWPARQSSKKARK